MAPVPASRYAPNPQLTQLAQDDDKLSDYIPASNEVSRVPSRQASEKVSDDEEDEEEEEEDQEEEEDEEDEDGDSSMKKGSSSKKEGKAEAKKANLIKKKAERKAMEGQFAARRAAQATLKSADSIKRFAYLLGQTDLFRHFCDLKAKRDPQFAEMLAESEKALGKGKSTKKGKATARARKTEKEEDDELLAENKDNDEDGVEGPFVFEESPPYVKGGKMRDYQVQGLNWMAGLHFNGINGILADEMGLGKTLQTISFLGYLKFHKGVKGPHLVIVPKSTLDNWAREFERWVPGFDVVLLKGGKEERAEVVQSKILPQSFDVIITSYELCLREKAALKKLSWEYIIIDEAHRIKNVDSMLSQIVRVFDSRARLLITGTPLQNNLHELWALLNFLLPDVFSDVADFDAWFDKQAPTLGPDGEVIETSAAEKEAASNSVVKQLHAVLRPFLLRRVKADVEKSLLPKKEINVYVGMTAMQRKWYKMILEKDIDAVNGAGGRKEGKTRLQNIVMQLRKCCNHPYLFDGAEPGPPFTTDEHLVDNSGKMKILDKLLKAMKAKGSRVLIFSQMSRVLDILEDYCMFREYKYCRLDGGTAHDDRMEAIDAYNKPNSEKFIFLLTTRAGGLGINLTSADIVVLYDSDWNPQADLQAMDRAHRIGQTKQVYVFRFVTENAVEEKVLERAAQKLRLDQLVIQQGRAQQNTKAANKDDLVEMIQHGAELIINSTESMEVQDDIEDIITRGEARTQELNSKYAQLNFDDLQIFKSETTTNWEGENYGGKKKIGIAWIEPSKRERKANYSVDGYYRDHMKLGGNRNVGPRGSRGPRQIAAHDFQFFPHRLIDLLEKEAANTRRTQNFVAMLREDPTMTAEELEVERAEQQSIADNAEPLTEEEIAEKDSLTGQGFPDWNKRDYQGFIRGSEAYGRDAYDLIQIEIPNKTVEEIKDYAEVFWDRYVEIDEYERQIVKIESAEAARAKAARQTATIRKKVESCTQPLQTMKIHYANQTKGKSYSEDEDRYLVCQLAKYGVGKDEVWENIKKDIAEFPAFRFDWFIKSRNAIEIGRRCTTLTQLIDKEYGVKDEATKAGNGDYVPTATASSSGKGKRKATDADSNASGSRASTPAIPSKKPRKSSDASDVVYTKKKRKKKENTDVDPPPPPKAVSCSKIGCPNLQDKLNYKTNIWNKQCGNHGNKDKQPRVGFQAYLNELTYLIHERKNLDNKNSVDFNKKILSTSHEALSVELKPYAENFRAQYSKATGWNFSYHQVISNAAGSTFVYHCSQDAKNDRPRDARKKEHDEDSIDSAREQKFGCRGVLRIRFNLWTSKMESHISHFYNHLSYNDRRMTLAQKQLIKTFIQSNVTLSPSRILTQVQKLAEEKKENPATAGQVRKYVQLLISERENGGLEVPKGETEVESVERIIGRSKGLEFVSSELGGDDYDMVIVNVKTFSAEFSSLTEIALDGTHGTTTQGWEIYSILGEIDGAGYPIAYAAIKRKDTSNLRKGKKRTRTIARVRLEAIINWFKIVRRMGINPKIIFCDKDFSEITAIQTVWSPNVTRIGICYWHALKAVKRRLQGNINPTITPYYPLDVRNIVPDAPVNFRPLLNNPAHLSRSGKSFNSISNIAALTHDFTSSTEPQSKSLANLLAFENEILVDAPDEIEDEGPITDTRTVADFNQLQRLKMKQDRKKKEMPKMCPKDGQLNKVMKLFTEHLNQHSTILFLEVEENGGLLTSAEIYRRAVREMLWYCHKEGLNDAWAYLWEHWYRPARWIIWARSTDERISVWRTTMGVEAHWSVIKNHCFETKRRVPLRTLFYAIDTIVIPRLERKLKDLREGNRTHNWRYGKSHWRGPFKREIKKIYRQNSAQKARDAASASQDQIMEDASYTQFHDRLNSERRTEANDTSSEEDIDSDDLDAEPVRKTKAPKNNNPAPSNSPRPPLGPWSPDAIPNIPPTAAHSSDAFAIDPYLQQLTAPSIKKFKRSRLHGTCSCRTFLLSRFLICKHIICAEDSPRLSPLYYDTVQRHTTSPYWRVPDEVAEIAIRRAAGEEMVVKASQELPEDEEDYYDLYHARDDEEGIDIGGDNEAQEEDEEEFISNNDRERFAERKRAREEEEEEEDKTTKEDAKRQKLNSILRKRAKYFSKLIEAVQNDDIRRIMEMENKTKWMSLLKKTSKNISGGGHKKGDKGKTAKLLGNLLLGSSVVID